MVGEEDICFGPTPGRGAVRNVTGRFEPTDVVPFDDGWGTLDAEPPVLQTTATPEVTRSVISRNDSPDIYFDQSVNPYRGCEHGCVYCFARPSHAFLNMSPGLDFESKIITKPMAPALLRAELRKPGYECKPIVLGSNTDPYQPIEDRLGITRGLLEVLAEFNNPVSIVTKSNRVLRDLDILVPMAREGRAAVFLSVTTLDRTLARVMEPRAATPERRIPTLARLTDAGILTGVLASPMIPALNDHELERILEAARGAGATAASFLLLRLPHELKQLFVDWLEAHYPDRAAKVLGQLRDMRDGKLYVARFGERMRGKGPYADLLRQRFHVACRRLGIKERSLNLDCSQFQVPPAPGDQARLF
jgi:DNA repair photolyase